MIKTPIIPEKVHFHGEKDTLDYEAICCFVATGFFLGRSTRYKSLKAYSPATIIDNKGKAKKWFEWHYNPRNINLKQATEEFADIFENIIKNLNLYFVLEEYISHEKAEYLRLPDKYTSS